MAKFIYTIIFYCIGIQSFAEVPFYYKINASDGLDNNTIYDIKQDHSGYYWIATDSGIYKYDGTLLNKINIKNPVGIHNIQLDKYGRVWFQNFDGELFFYFKDILSKIKKIKLKGYFEYQIIDDKLYLPLQNNFAEINLKDLTYKPLYNLKTNSLKNTFIVKNKLGYITNTSLAFYDKSLELYDIKSLKALSNPICTTVGDNVYIFDKYAKDFYCLFSNNKLKIIKDHFDLEFKQNITSFGSSIWISSTAGLLRFNTITGIKTKYYSDKNISQIYKDRYSHYWITTLTEGILFVENLNSKISNAKINPLLLSQLNNQLIIGTIDDKIYKYSEGKTTSILNSSTNHPYILLKTDTIDNSILATSSKFRWIKNINTQEALYSIKDITPIGKNNFAFVASRNIGIMTNDPKIASYNAKNLSHFDQTKYGNLYFTLFNTEINGKSVAFNPKNNKIYYATKNGLLAFSKTNLYELTTDNKNSIYIKKMIYKDGSVICLSNLGKMLEITSDDKIKEFYTPSFLKNDEIKDFKIINNSIYLFTKKSVYQFNQDTNEALKILNVNPNFNVTDVENIGDTIYFATTLGILKKKKTQNLNDYIPDFKITSILVNNNLIDTANVRKFSTSENNFEIRFKLISSIPNEFFKISYQINNDRWKNINPKARAIILPSLAHGDYKIKIKVEGTFDNALIEEIDFSINHPFWYSPYFISFIFLTITAVCYKIYLQKIKKVQQKNTYLLRQIELENEINIQKLKSLQSQMNPHFFFNALNTIQSYILSNDKKIAVYYLSKFSKLTRQILNLSSKDFISLKEELETNEIYLEIEKSRFNDDFTYQINNINNVNLEQWRFPSLLLQPLIENALKHGLLHKKGHKYLDIIISEINDKILISIIDNGIGRTASTKINSNRVNHQAFATKAIENRIKIINESFNLDLKIDYIDLYDSQNRATGTEVKITLNKQTYESNNN